MSLYGEIYRRMLFPLYDGVLRGRDTIRYMKIMEAGQWSSFEEVQKRQWGWVEKLMAHAYENVEFYRHAWEEQGLTPREIGGPEGFTALPLVARETINEHRERMVARTHRDQVMRKSTGGSTGMPLHFYITRESYEWRVAASAMGYGWAGCRDGEKTFYVWGAPIGTPPFLLRAKTALHNFALRRAIFNSFRFSPEVMGECLKEMNQFRPSFIIGYTNPLVSLARFILEGGRRCFSPVAVLTGAENLYPHQRELLEEVFQCPAFNTYGSREFMLIASECEHHSLHVTADNLLVEIVRDGRPAKDGELGEIAITDLHNLGMPFIRYLNGDLAVASSARCPCGRGLPVIERIEGRVLDMVQTCDGRTVPGEFFPHLIKEFPEIEKFQVIQECLEKIRVLLVVRTDLSQARLSFLRGEIVETVGERTKVDFEYVDDIPLTATGKLRVVVSKVPLDFGNRNV